MHTHHLRLCAATACLGLLLSLITTSAAPRAQVDNSNQSMVGKSARKKATRRQTRRTRRRATAGNPSLPKLEVPPLIAPTEKKVKPPYLPMPVTIDVDPTLVPPKQKRKEDERKTGNGLGTGSGVGSGAGAGVGPGRGGNVGNGESGAGNGPENDGAAAKPAFSPREVERKARIIYAPEPQYTAEARKNGVTGTVVIKAIFSSSGAVTNIRAVNELPDGLTLQAIEAARQIKFAPAMIGGRAVSQYVQIEYNFIP